MHDARELRSAVYTVKYRTGWSCTEIALTIFSTEPVHFYEVLPWEWHIHKLSTVPCNSAPCLSKYLLGSSAPELLSTENKYTWLLCTRALFISIKISFWRTGWFLIMRKKCHLFFFYLGSPPSAIHHLSLHQFPHIWRVFFFSFCLAAINWNIIIESIWMLAT